MRRTEDVEWLRPIAAEGQSVLGCVTFVPLSIVAILAAAFARSLLDGAACAMSEHRCRSANGVRLHPVSLGVVIGRPAAGIRPHMSDTDAVGLARPGGVRFVPRVPGSPWDVPSHYSAIASGALPYAVGLERCPRYTLHSAPKALLLRVRDAFDAAARARDPIGASRVGAALASAAAADERARRNGTALPPPQSHLSRAFARFDRADPAAEAGFLSLQRELREHARRHMTTAAEARRLLRLTLGSLETLHPRGGKGPGAPAPAPAPNSGRFGGGGSANVTGASARGGAGASPRGRLRALLLRSSAHDAQMAALHNGLSAIGVEVDEQKAAPRHGHSARRAPLGTYDLYLVQWSGDDAAEAHAAHEYLLRGVEPARVACVRSDDAPPPAWSLWVPPYCGRAFVKEMRL